MLIYFQEFVYGRMGNPTRNTLEACLAALDGGKHGLTFPSGMAATSAIYALLRTGDHLICCDGVYHGTNELFRYFKKVGGSRTPFLL